MGILLNFIRLSYSIIIPAFVPRAAPDLPFGAADPRAEIKPSATLLRGKAKSMPASIDVAFSGLPMTLYLKRL
jgi:hypothetical protein